MGGHLTHGSPVNFQANFIVPSFYGVEENTGYNYNKVEETALRKTKINYLEPLPIRDWDYVAAFHCR